MSEQATDLDRAIGAAIRKARVEAGLTQSALAERLAVTYQQLHKYERGLNRVSAGRLIELADALGLPPERLIAEARSETGRAAEASAASPRAMLELSKAASALPPDAIAALTAVARRMGGREAAP